MLTGNGRDRRAGRHAHWRKDGHRLTLYDAQGSPTLGLTWSNVLGYDIEQPAPTPTWDPNLGPVGDESRMAVDSPSATST
ncbi:MAG: hypothetical protein ACOH16_08070 [Propionibacteriaceae bacterium]